MPQRRRTETFAQLNFFHIRALRGLSDTLVVILVQRRSAGGKDANVRGHGPLPLRCLFYLAHGRFTVAVVWKRRTERLRRPDVNSSGERYAIA